MTGLCACVCIFSSVNIADGAVLFYFTVGGGRRAASVTRNGNVVNLCYNNVWGSFVIC